MITPGQIFAGKVGVQFSRIPAHSGTLNSWAATGLPVGLSIDSSTGLISGTPLRKGDTAVTLTATGTGGTSSVTATISVAVGAPMIQPGQTITGKVGEPFSSELLLTDPEDRPVTSWVLGGELQSGLSFNSTTGRISGTPTRWGIPHQPPFQNFQAPASVDMTLTGPGGTGPRTPFNLVINFGKPDIVKGQVFSSVVGLFFDVSPQANGGQNRPIDSWSVTGLPSWAMFDATTGRIYGTTSQQDVGRTIITLTATGEGGTDSTTAEIFIATGAPIITENQVFSGKVDQAFSATPALTDSANRPAFSWSAVDLPTGLSLNTSTGAITGTPKISGSLTATITASGQQGQASSATSITFEIAPEIPIIAPNQVFSGAVGVSFSATPSLVNPEGRPVHAPIYRPPTETQLGGFVYLKTWEATGLPSGFEIHAGTGQIYSFPAAQNAGEFVVTLKAFGPAGESDPVTATISIAVGPPIITSGQSFAGKFGESFSATPTLDDSANRPATSWAITSGTLPSGLTLNTATGAITGTPTAKVNRTVFLRASGAGGVGTETSISISIGDGVPIITPGQSFAGEVGQAFSQTPGLTDAANRPVTSWSASGLPPGLSINPSTGAITGTPNTEGVFTATITATGPGGSDTETIGFSVIDNFPLYRGATRGRSVYVGASEGKAIYYGSKLLWNVAGWEPAMFSPKSIPGLRLWLDASVGLYDAATGGNIVTTAVPVLRWEDQSGNGFHATAVSATAPSLALSQVNSLPALVFNGSQQFTVPNVISSATAASAFVVVVPSSLGGDGGPMLGNFGSASSSGHYPYQGGAIYDKWASTSRKGPITQPPGFMSWHLYHVHNATGDWRYYFNGAPHFTTQANTFSGGTFGLSTYIAVDQAGGTYRFRGAIAEIVIYDSALSESDRQAVTEYLRAKYNLWTL